MNIEILAMIRARDFLKQHADGKSISIEVDLDGARGWVNRDFEPQRGEPVNADQLC